MLKTRSPHCFHLAAALLAGAVLSIPPLNAGQPAPRIFYSDLESGPNTGGEKNGGAIVTIHGKRFGTSQGSSLVTTGGGQVLSYPCWSDTRVCFQLGASAKSGQIVLTNSAGISNGVPFDIRPGKIYFVSTSGKDTNSGAFPSPWQTLLKARDTMKPGDITYALNGVTQSTDDGQGWNTCMLLRIGGQPGLPMALVAYPGATVTVGNVNGPSSGIRSNEHSPGYWVFAGLTLRGLNEAVTPYGPSSHWRLVGNDLSCPNGNGQSACFETSLTSHDQLLGNNVHDTGVVNASSAYHAVYFSTDSNHIEIGWNTISNVHGCRGIQIHSSPVMGGGPNDPTGHNQYGISIHDNVIHDTQCDGIILATVDPSKGPVEVYNNLIYNAGKGPANPENSGNWACIYAPGYTNSGPVGQGRIQIYNNTLFNCGTFNSPPYGDSRGGIMNGGHNPQLQLTLSNNIDYQTGTIPYVIPANETGGIRGSNNLFWGTGSAPATSHIGNSLNRDPLFSNPWQGDFHLKPGSPARGAGTQAPAKFDFDGLPRDPATGFDMGAYQYVEDYTPSSTATSAKLKR